MNKLIIIIIVLYNGATINLIGCNSICCLLHLLQLQCSTRLGLIANLQYTSSILLFTMIESKSLNIANTKFTPANQYKEFAALNLLSIHTIINMYNSSNNMLIF